MRRRDLKIGMKVVICPQPWARRVLRDSKMYKWENKYDEWSTKHGALIHCSEAFIRQDFSIVEDGAGILIKYKTFEHSHLRPKKTRRKEVWCVTVVRPIDILLPWEDFEPKRDEINLEMKNIWRKRAKCICFY